MEEELRALLQASADLAGVADEAISWIEHPQGVALPGVVLNLVTGAEGVHQAGPDGLTRATVQVDCYGATYVAAKTASRGVIDTLHGYKGGGFQGVFHLATREGREGGTNTADRPFRVSLDIELFWRHTT